MFKDAKVGDRVWSVRRGWGNIKTIHDGRYSLIVKFENCPELGSYRFDGKEFHHDTLSTLFWDEVKIIPPPKPKRKVKGVIEGWVNLFTPPLNVCEGVGYGCTNIFSTRESLERHKREKFPGNKFLGDPIFIRHEYEVEE